MSNHRKKIGSFGGNFRAFSQGYTYGKRNASEAAPSQGCRRREIEVSLAQNKPIPGRISNAAARGKVRIVLRSLEHACLLLAACYVPRTTAHRIEDEKEKFGRSRVPAHDRYQTR